MRESSLGSKPVVTTAYRAPPKHPVMRLCLSTVASCDQLWLRWAVSSQAPWGRLILGFCFGRSLNFKEGYKQTPDLPNHEPLIVTEAQEHPVR